MNSTPPRPRHPSYLVHRSQVVWQILLPVILAGLLLIAAVVLIYLGAFRASGDLERWAAISTMWLTIPVMIAALIILAVMIGVTYLLGRLAGFIPRYTYPVQNFAAQVEAGAKRVQTIGHRPLLIFPELGRLIRMGFRKIRRG